jgi:prolyl-tRNA synthetase
MRFSRFFAPTTKEAPHDALLISHINLIRAGFITQVSAGIYDLLPLGKIVLDRIRAVVKDELDKAGCMEVQLGFVTPAELWMASNRYEKYGKELLRFKDRKDIEFVLGPTHEEMMVELVKNRVTSYKQLPINLYQINLKFRDEARPRFGLMRGREFLMKDGYSFHSTYDDMIREFSLMETTYRKIFDRLGLAHRVVEADSGAIGGSGSKEFMVLAGSGEDTIVICNECEYASNIEAAKRTAINYNLLPLDETTLYTPNISSIDDLSNFLKLPKEYFIKAIVKRALYDNNISEIVIFFVRGTDELEDTKAKNSVNANDIIDIADYELKANGIEVGFIGIDIKGFKKIVDLELMNSKNLVTGANRVDYHNANIDINSIDDITFFDIIVVSEGDKCPICESNLSLAKGIEVGHIFQLGTKYSEPLKAKFLDINGKSQDFIMGTYGIGVSRLIAAVVEQHHDNRGIIWTKETAPFMVDIIVSNIKDASQMEFAEYIYNILVSKSISVILDDRNERFGPKINDFELIGFPFAIVVGKNLESGIVEIIDRKTLSKTTIQRDNVIEAICSLI